MQVEGHRDLRLRIVETELTPAAAEAATLAVLRASDRPTAVATGGDGSLPGILEGIAAAALELGHDLSLVTSDPGPLAQVFRPPLSAIVRDGTVIGRQAAELLLERIAIRASRRAPPCSRPASSHGHRSARRRG